MDYRLNIIEPEEPGSTAGRLSALLVLGLFCYATGATLLELGAWIIERATA